MDGRAGLYVEDLFAAERARGLGLGRRPIVRLTAIARARLLAHERCGAAWEPGARLLRVPRLRQIADRLAYQRSGAALARLAAEDGEART